MSLLGAKLHHLRSLHRLTQAQLAAALKLSSHSHISHLESNRKQPSLSLVHDLARYFGTTTDYLLDDRFVIDEVPHYPIEDTGTSMQHFGEKLRDLRLKRSWTQSELAQRLALRTHTHVSMVENKQKDPSIEFVVNVAIIFGITTDSLIRDSVQLGEI